MIRVIPLIVVLSLALAGCEKLEEESSGVALGYVESEPPVTANTSSALQDGSVTATAVSQSEASAAEFETAIDIIDDLFEKNYPRMGNHECKGLVHCALASMDDRMEELDSRNRNSERACTTAELRNDLLDYELSGGNKLDMSLKLQCSEQLSSSSADDFDQWLAFGRDTENFYLKFQQTHGILWAAQVGLDERDVEAFIIADHKDQITPFHLISHEQKEVIELTSGIHNMVCGVRVRANPDWAYLEYRMENHDNTCAGDLEPVKVCVNGKTGDIQTNLTDCTEAGLDQFELDEIKPYDLDRTTLKNRAGDVSFIKELGRF